MEQKIKLTIKTSTPLSIQVFQDFREDTGMEKLLKSLKCEEDKKDAVKKT